MKHRVEDITECVNQSYLLTMLPNHLSYYNIYDYDYDYMA